MKATRLLSLLFVAVGLCAVVVLFPKKPVRGDSGGVGSISGTIVFEGAAPKMPEVQMAANPECEAMHSEPVYHEMLVLDEEQHLANVMVQVVAGLPEGRTYPIPEEPFEMTQKGCMYSPHVFGVRAGQEVKILNPDAILHNIHAMPKVNSEFNRSMNSQRTEITTVFKVAEPVFEIKCDVHAWMQAYCAVFDHPFFAVSGNNGKFEIPDLPPGEYEIEAWHERLGTQRAKVTVAAGQSAVSDFTFKRPGT